MWSYMRHYTSMQIKFYFKIIYLWLKSLFCLIFHSLHDCFKQLLLPVCVYFCSLTVHHPLPVAVCIWDLLRMKSNKRIKPKTQIQHMLHCENFGWWFANTWADTSFFLPDPKRLRGSPAPGFVGFSLILLQIIWLFLLVFIFYDKLEVNL